MTVPTPPKFTKGDVVRSEITGHYYPIIEVGVLDGEPAYNFGFGELYPADIVDAMYVLARPAS